MWVSDRTFRLRCRLEMPRLTLRLLLRRRTDPARSATEQGLPEYLRCAGLRPIFLPGRDSRQSGGPLILGTQEAGLRRLAPKWPVRQKQCIQSLFFEICERSSSDLLHLGGKMASSDDVRRVFEDAMDGLSQKQAGQALDGG